MLDSQSLAAKLRAWAASLCDPLPLPTSFFRARLPKKFSITGSTDHGKSLLKHNSCMPYHIAKVLSQFDMMAMPKRKHCCDTFAFAPVGPSFDVLGSSPQADTMASCTAATPSGQALVKSPGAHTTPFQITSPSPEDAARVGDGQSKVM